MSECNSSNTTTNNTNGNDGGTPSPEQQQPQQPRTEAQREASRRNGANSRGPGSPSAKAASRKNALRHGLTASKLLLANEDPTLFNNILAYFHASCRPSDDVEHAIVHDIAYARWGLLRTRTTTSAAYNAEMSRNKPAMAEQYVHYDESTRVANALESSLTRSPAITALSRAEARYFHQFHRSLAALDHYRKHKLPNEPESSQENQQLSPRRGRQKPGKT